MKKIAIIGTSVGQKGLYLAAKRMGVKSIGFSIPNTINDISCLADEHYVISVVDTDKIVEICRGIGVDGVVSNGSDLTAKCSNEIACKLGLICNKPFLLDKAANKYYVRQVTQNIAELGQVKCKIFDGTLPTKYPVIIKPHTAGGKSGLSIAKDENSFCKAIDYALDVNKSDILIEEFIEGLELSVETLSANGQHYVIQTCEADTTGEPHFVETAHHLPANISEETDSKIKKVVPMILDAIGFENGATDIEMKVDEKGKIYLIEINLRGAGGNITNDLVKLSTGYDYLQGLIEIALGCFKKPVIRKNEYAGDYYLCKQTSNLIPLFKRAEGEDWLVCTNITESHYSNLKEIKTNGDREGFIIYKSDHKIGLKDVDRK